VSPWLRRRGDTGAATLLALSVAVVLAVGAAVGVMAGGAVLARHRASGVADVTALAAAHRLLLPAAEVCAAARRTAEANGSRLRTCAGEGAAVVVQVATPTPPWLAWLGSAAGRARAGLVSDISDQAGPTGPPS
jgi:secretion/DNA translocation related TadE-like protein